MKAKSLTKTQNKIFMHHVLQHLQRKMYLI